MSRTAITLALLPFENLTGEAADAALAGGFLQDLIAEIARFPLLGVVAADSVWAGRPDGLGDAAFARLLGATHFLKGSVRRVRTSLRLGMQLAGVEDRRHLWAGRYDSADLLALPDEIAAKVANALAVGVDRSVLGVARRRAITSLEAHECWLRGMDCLHQGTPESDLEGRRFFERARACDPHYARAWAGLSLSHFNEWSCQAWSRWEEKERLAYEHAVRAEALDPNDAVVQVILGRIELYRREFARAGPRFDRARQLAPNDANVLMQLACCLAYQGDAETGRRLARRAMELNPLCPVWHFCFTALPSFPLRKYEEFLEIVSRAPPGLVVDVPAFKAAACAYLGDRRRAAEFLGEFRAGFHAKIACGREPGPEELLQWLMHVNPYRREEDARHFAEGLRRAGLEGAVRAPSSAPLSWPIANVFRREGAVWRLSFDHQAAQMPELRGFGDLARLLARPGEEIPSADLAGRPVRSTGIESLDTRARASYRARLREIEEGIGEASGAGRIQDAVRLEKEREAILSELKAATGLGGRSRRTGGSDERSRTAVTWRIRSAIRKIEEVHPALGRHLRHSVRTGAFCVYRPERETAWHV